MVVAAAFKSLLLVMLFVGVVMILDRRETFSTPRMPNFKNSVDGRITSIPKLREHVFSLSQFGGAGDGTTLNTRAFREAVAAIRYAGSGQLTVHPGVWLTAPFNLTSNMTLFLAQGAVIMAAKDEDFWPVLPPLRSYGRGGDFSSGRYGGFVHGEKLNDVVITGHNGTIDGQGTIWWQLNEMGQLHHTRGSLIELFWCSNVEISDVNLVNSPYWTLHPFDSKNITIRRVNVFAPDGAPDTAGIVPDSCQDVFMENCQISVRDDCVAVKSGWYQHGTVIHRPSVNIIIRNVVARSYTSAGVALGSEIAAGISNVSVEGLHVWGSKVGVIIKTTPGRGGYVRNVRYNNVLLEDVEVGVVIDTNDGEHPNSYSPPVLPVLNNISYHGFYGNRVTHFAKIYATQEIPVRGVEFKDIYVNVVPAASRKATFNTSRCSFRQGNVLMFPNPCEARQLQ